MTYEQALAEVDKRLIFGSKPGLERMEAVMAALGNPEKRLRFVHVGGTNGKGTTCTYIASVLQQAGYKTGLYTSPYVVDFRERFQINGEMISKEALAAQAEKLCAIKDPVVDQLTEFSFITSLAFNWFAEEGCDIVVLEVGLGGRFDATNIIESPEVAVITSVSLDHTAFLGDTVEKIAFEKAGIIKPGTSLVLYPEQPGQVKIKIKEICAEQKAEFIPVRQDITVMEETLLGSRAVIGGRQLFVPFSGHHQLRNAATALTALEVLIKKGWNIGEAAIKAGFAKARIPARMELLQEEPPVILDGGHNPGCAQALKCLLEKHLPGKRICAVMGMMRDKDSTAYLRLTAPLFAQIICVQPANSRALEAETLCNAAKAYCDNCCAAAAMEEAAAKALTAEADAVVICGSLFLAGEIRGILLRRLEEESLRRS